ncbi:hypothetical protein ACWGJ2_03665 [Streptomyces sp. NPDC054796]
MGQAGALGDVAHGAAAVQEEVLEDQEFAGGEFGCVGVHVFEGDLGQASAELIQVRRDPADSRLVTVAGWPYAALWTAAMALRLGSAYGSTHWFTDALATFSVQHQVPAATYGTAFVLMVLAMIAVRTVGVLVRARLAGATAPPHPGASPRSGT